MQCSAAIRAGALCAVRLRLAAIPHPVPGRTPLVREKPLVWFLDGLAVGNKAHWDPLRRAGVLHGRKPRAASLIPVLLLPLARVRAVCVRTFCYKKRKQTGSETDKTAKTNRTAEPALFLQSHSQQAAPRSAVYAHWRITQSGTQRGIATALVLVFMGSLVVGLLPPLCLDSARPFSR